MTPVLTANQRLRRIDACQESGGKHRVTNAALRPRRHERRSEKKKRKK